MLYLDGSPLVGEDFKEVVDDDENSPVRLHTFLLLLRLTFGTDVLLDGKGRHHSPSCEYGELATVHRAQELSTYRPSRNEPLH